MSGDYKQRSVYNHPLFPGRVTVEEHRLVMAEYLGRPLLSHEWIHHKDGDKRNNVISNLEITTASHHNNQHFGGLKRPGVSEKLKGRKHSVESRELMSNKRQISEKLMSDENLEARRLIGKTLGSMGKGKTKSEETRQKMRIAAQKREQIKRERRLT